MLVRNNILKSWCLQKLISLKDLKKFEDVFENLKQIYFKEELLRCIPFSHFFSILTTSKIKKNILTFLFLEK